MISRCVLLAGVAVSSVSSLQRPTTNPNDVRTYECATLYADVQAGKFQLYFLQWTGGSLADPNILLNVVRVHTTAAN